MSSSFLSSQKKVLFVHRGVSLGRFVLFVSDGKHYVSTLLEVIIMSSHFMWFMDLFIRFLENSHQLHWKQPCVGQVASFKLLK